MTGLVLSLNRDEWEPYVICLAPRGHFADVLESANVPVKCLNAKGIRSLPRVFFLLTRELQRLRPALVQTFLFHANILGRIAARIAGIPVVVSGLRVAEHRSLWYGRIDRWTNSLVATNVCVSQGVADFSERITGLKRTKLCVIPNAVDAERFANASPADLTTFGIPPGSRVLITVGRLDHQKGIDLLLSAISLMKPLEDDVHFLIVGDGEQAQTLRQQTIRDGLPARVHFIGRRDDVPSLLAASTALVLPSRWEGMPNVILEAMAAGLPVIATDVEGIAELVRDRVTGLIVPPENPVELASAICWLLTEPDFRSEAEKKSQNIAASNFTQQLVTNEYVNVYRKLLSND